MHKISNLTGFGAARHGLDKMTPSMPFSNQRQHPDIPPGGGPGMKQRDAAGVPRQNANRLNHISLSFNVPFSSTLAGPEPNDIIHASPGSFKRWTHPEGAPDGTPTHQLPVHMHNVEALRAFCKMTTETSEGTIQASVTSSEPKPLLGLQLGGPSKSIVTNVCLSGNTDAVKKTRYRIFNNHPICLVGEMAKSFSHVFPKTRLMTELAMRNRGCRPKSSL